MNDTPVTAPAPVAPAAPAEVAAPVPTRHSPLPNGGLPESVQIPNKNYDATEFFEKHKQNNSPTPTPAAPAVAPVAPAVPANPAAEAPKGSVAAKLAARHRALEPVAAPAVSADPNANPEDKLSLYADETNPKPNTPAAQWKEIKGITKGLRDQLIGSNERIRDLESQLAAAKSGMATPDQAEIEKLRAEHKEMSDKLALSNLREHPEFKKTVLDPQDSAISEVEAILGANNIAADIRGLMRKPKAEFLKAVGEATKGLSVAEQVEVATHLRGAYQLHQQEEQMATKARETYGALRNQSAERHKAMFENTWKRVASPITEHLVEVEAPDNATPEQRQEIDAYNASIRGLRGSAERIALGSSTPEEVATASIKAAAYDLHVGTMLPRLMSEYDSLVKHNGELAAQLRAIQARNPNRAGVAPGASAGGPADPQDPRNMDHRAAAEHFFNQRT